MRPVKAKDLIVSTALELNLPVTAVSTIVGMYYRDAREALTELKDVRIHLTNLGDFTLKHWLLDKYETKYKEISSNTKVAGIRKDKIDEDMTKKLKLIECIRKKLDEECQRKDFIKQHKYQLNEKKQSIKDLEE